MSRGSIGTFVGAGIGFLVGGPGGAQIGAMLGGAVGGSFDTVEGRKVGEMASPRAQEGEPIPLVFGSARVTGRLMSTGKPDIRKEKEGGKGGPKVENETAYLSYSILVAESSALRDSTITGILMVIQNNEIVYDVRATPAISAADSAKWKKNKIFYFGGEAQAVDPTEQMIHGVGNVPAYRGLCRMVVTDEDVTQHGGSVPTYEFVTTQCGVVAPVADFPFTWLIHSVVSPPKMYVGNQDGTSFTTSFSTATTSDYPLGLPGGRILLAGNGPTKKSDDFLATAPTTIAGAPSFTSPIRRGEDGRLFGLNSSLAQLYYSDNEGDTWTTVSLPINAQLIAVGGGSVVVNLGSNRCVSTDNGVTFGSAIANGFICHSLGYGNSLFLFGRNSGPPHWAGNPALALTAGTGASALSQSNTLLPMPDGSWISIHTDNSASTTNNIMRSPDGKTGWAYVTTPSCHFEASETNRAAINAGVVIAAAKNATGFLRIIRSTDGVTWTDVPHSYGATAATGIGVSALPNGVYVGAELPDVPGYYVHTTTSEITGPVSVAPDCGVALSTIVEKLDSRAGIPVANRVTTSLAGITVPGYAIDTFQTVAEAKEPLRRVYFFDCPEYDDAIRYRLRGGATDFTVLPDDLIIGDEATEQGTRGQTVEFQKRLHVQYVDAATGYKPMKQTAERISPDIRVKGDEVVSANMTLSATTAKRAADIGLKTAWTAREDSREIVLPIDYLKAIPSDCYSLSGRRYRITDLRIEAGALYIQSEYDRTSAYSSTVVGTVGPAPTAPPSNIIGPTDFVVMNLPVLRDADDDPVLYFAARGYTAGWNGARLQLAMPGFETVANITTACIMGTLLAPLPVASRDVLDTTNTISVRMSGSLNSVTYAALLNEANVLAILYADNTAEILQFQTATEVTPGVYDLTTLIRGRLDTDIATHATGARVVLLNDSIRSFIVRRTELLRPPLWFRVVTNGLPEPALNDPATTLYVSNVETESTKEWPVADIQWSRNGSNDLVVTWIGRARLGTDAQPAHSRFFSGYRVTVTNGTVIRSWDTTLQSAIVTSAEQVSVFGSNSFTPTVTVTPTSTINGAEIGDGVPFPVGLAGWTSTEAGWSYVAGSAVYDPTVSGVAQSMLRFTTPTAFAYGPRLFYASCERIVSGNSVGGVGYAHYSGATFTGKFGVGTVHYTLSTVTADPIPTADGIAPIVYANTDGVTSVSFSNIAHSISE